MFIVVARHSEGHQKFNSNIPHKKILNTPLSVLYIDFSFYTKAVLVRDDIYSKINNICIIKMFCFRK